MAWNTDDYEPKSDHPTSIMNEALIEDHTLLFDFVYDLFQWNKELSASAEELINKLNFQHNFKDELQRQASNSRTY